MNGVQPEPIPSCGKPQTSAEPSAPLLPSQVLDAAADLIEPEGRWHQGHLAGDDRGRHLTRAITGADFCARCWCAYGAIQKAGWNASRERDRKTGGLSSFHRHEKATGEIVARVIGGASVTDLASWNDAPDRTQAEVVKALRDAAELARSEGR